MCTNKCYIALQYYLSFLFNNIDAKAPEIPPAIPPEKIAAFSTPKLLSISVVTSATKIEEVIIIK